MELKPHKAAPAPDYDAGFRAGIEAAAAYLRNDDIMEPRIVTVLRMRAAEIRKLKPVLSND